MLVVGGNYKGDLQVYQKTCLEIWIVQDWEFSPSGDEKIRFGPSRYFGVT
jgi:hypothetical protein